MNSLELNNTIKTLKQGGIILYPTDTVWGLGCDSTNFSAVEKLYKLKNRKDEKAMICLVNDFKMLNYHVEEIPEAAYSILEHAEEPTTIVYDKPLRVTENLIAADNTLAIRMVKEGFCADLLKRFKKPIVSTSANISGKSTPKTFQEIEEYILKGVDYVVNLDHTRKASKTSSIIKLSNNGEVKVIRK
ncbi:MAG: L-threonylcarbamoyladenylate synthase [Flavobacteriales bacterium]|jgi:L-threonylcarbamoyladenylate synthase|tara:strand:- start:3239 stop:3802 length:564 start_codon:yes stop_codon:yes gene_type:complete